MSDNLPLTTGRGAQIAPPNRFETLRREHDWEQIEGDEDYFQSLAKLPTVYLPDASRSIVTSNDSPDVFFTYSLNPYRGCSHGCSYCYARPSHEYLGMNAGLDFESKILVKHEAAKLLREFLAEPKWTGEQIVLSGVTDPYQPAEREFRITRGCLEVAAEARQPIGIITKNALVVRDLDLLSRMAADETIHANVSITTLDAELARSMEPRTSSPGARLRAVRALSDAGVPVRVMVAPIIPGLNDMEIPAILEAAAEAGAKGAGYVLLRLPFAVKPVFQDWLERVQTLRKEKVESLLRSMRSGKLYDSAWGSRLRGTGEIADQIAKMFKVFLKKYGLDRPMSPLRSDRFQPPRPLSGQMRLF